MHLLHMKMFKLSWLMGTIIHCVIYQNLLYVFINRNIIYSQKNWMLLVNVFGEDKIIRVKSAQGTSSCQLGIRI